MSPEELIAYGRGYVDGWARSDELAELDGRPEPPPVAPSWRSIEAAARRALWDRMVLAGEYPDPAVIEANLWKEIEARIWNLQT